MVYRKVPKAHFGGETAIYIPNHSGLDHPVDTGIDSVLERMISRWPEKIL